MKIFVIGLPQSGRTKVARALSEARETCYISASKWIDNSFRKPFPLEREEDYNKEYFNYSIAALKDNPFAAADCIHNQIIDHNVCYPDDNTQFIIDNLTNPKDLIDLMDVDQKIDSVMKQYEDEKDAPIGFQEDFEEDHHSKPKEEFVPQKEELCFGD